MKAGEVGADGWRAEFQIRTDSRFGNRQPIRFYSCMTDKHQCASGKLPGRWASVHKVVRRQEAEVVPRPGRSHEDLVCKRDAFQTGRLTMRHHGDLNGTIEELRACAFSR